MQCREAQAHIDDYLDELLDSTDVEALTAHYQQCDQCAELLAQTRQFRQLLKTTPVPPPSAGFVDRALRNAVQQHAEGGRHDSHGDVYRHSHKHSHRKGFITGFGSALAAGLALWAVVSLFPSQQTAIQQQAMQQPMQQPAMNQTVAQAPAGAPAQGSGTGGNTISISLQEPTNITLAFHAAKAVQGATITISLSDNLQLAGYQNRQILEWKTDLLAGDNVLTLPIKALNPQQGKIIARVSHSNLMKSIELNLNVNQGSDVTKPVSGNDIIATPVA
jgi:hypothetical protein